MAFSTSQVECISFFYPLGNTPAICVTQDLAFESAAEVLLLGCGDVRNILFTCYNDSNPKRLFDFTCCDIEAAVLARNILLLTLILDGVHLKRQTSLWNIYHHFYLGAGDVELVHSQAQKLVELSQSQERWGKSAYGKSLQFCNKGTLESISRIWKSFKVLDLNENERKSYSDRFAKRIDATRCFLKKRYPGGKIMSCIRSAAPVSLLGMEELSKLFEKFWEHGTLVADAARNCTIRDANPLFASPLSHNTHIHYGVDPLAGYHLANAYVPLEKESTLQIPSQPAGAPAVVRAAMNQFSLWCQAFKKRSLSVRVRILCCDALAACHLLQSAHGLRKDDGGNLAYESSSPVSCNFDDATDLQATTPSHFNVIDTTNLADHVGILNLLVGCYPMLSSTSEASLYTENLVGKKEHVMKFEETLLHGDFKTISTLLGLYLADYWTNASLTSPEEAALDAVFSSISGQRNKSLHQMQCRHLWKKLSFARNAPKKVIIETSHLIDLLYKLFTALFPSENIGAAFSGLLQGDTTSYVNSSLPQYHRGGFAMLLNHFRKTVSVGWDVVIEGFLERLARDTSLALNLNYIQELFVHMHLYGVYTVEKLKSTSRGADVDTAIRLSDKPIIPEIVCITFKVPRNRLALFSNASLDENSIGTPTLVASLEATNPRTGKTSQNWFACLHVCFGTVSVNGDSSLDSFHISISKDSQQWTGDSDLFVSFWVPSWILQLEAEDISVALGIQSTVHLNPRIIQEFGLQLQIYRCALNNTDHVYISRQFPRILSGTLINAHVPVIFRSHVDVPEFHGIIKLQCNANCKVSSLTTRLELLSSEIARALKEGASVTISQLGAFDVELRVTTGQKAWKLPVHFPLPITLGGSTVKIGRKSGFIALELPLLDPRKAEPLNDPMFSCTMDTNGVTIWNCARTNLDIQPSLNKSLKKSMQWLITHVSIQMSDRERKLREQFLNSAENCPEARVNLKDSIHSLFIRHAGLQGDSFQVFGLSIPNEGGIHTMILVSKIRLDLGNHTALLDAAVIPLKKKILPLLRQFLNALAPGQICQILVDREETKLWRHYLAICVERCRNWSHLSTCEYSVYRQFPVSADRSESSLCSCGLGKLPSQYTSLPHWNVAKKFAARAAISPIYPVPYVDAMLQSVPT